MNTKDMLKMNNNLLVLGIIAVILAGCTNSGNESNNNKINMEKVQYKNMTVDELNAQLKSKDFALIDVHIPEQKHINGTDAFIPYDGIENQLDKLPKEKDAKIVLYCRTGRMSQIAAEKLASKGYTNVYNVVGGIVEWTRKGYGQKEDYQ